MLPNLEARLKIFEWGRGVGETGRRGDGEKGSKRLTSPTRQRGVVRNRSRLGKHDVLLNT